MIAPTRAVAQRPADRVADRIAALRVAEDRRGRDTLALAALFSALADPDSVVRRVAVEGLGRQERPEVSARLFAMLRDESASVRATAANAIAQSLRPVASAGRGTASDAQRRIVDSAVAAFARRVDAETSPQVRGALARSLARLPFPDSSSARKAEHVALQIAMGGSEFEEVEPKEFGMVHGLYALARQRRTLGPLDDTSVVYLSALNALAIPRLRGSGRDPETLARIRRLVWLTRAAAGIPPHPALLADSLLRAMRDPDAQVRRLVVAHLPNVSDTALRRQILDAAARDSSFLVRVEWARRFQALTGGTDCRPLIAALRDPNPHVRLAAIDVLGETCPPSDGIAARLREIIATGPSDARARRPGEVSWHARAHALVTLAQVDSASARPLVARDAAHPVWQVRMYAARAAAVVRDTQRLARLAQDSVGNVREAAIDGLAATAGHDADHVYIGALASRDDHVVLTAAKALRGTPSRSTAVPRLIEALERLSAQRRETSRDVRLELLDRIGELGYARFHPLLGKYLSDFDEAVAVRVAEIAQRQLGSRPRASPRALPYRPPPGLENVLAADTLRLRVTMSPATGGGSFVLRLRPEIAPVTVSRVLALVRSGYYNGLTWHRVVPNFVVQGGSPGMNEYVGDGPFMRDELSLESHVRGTLGISTRGRDTGDAQWFINLVDNYRLDHDYTVWAVVESGMDVVDGILEGDVMERVEVVGATGR